jgi:hypothetical protein
VAEKLVSVNRLVGEAPMNLVKVCHAKPPLQANPALLQKAESICAALG